jgi:FtsP/CotA-like multicopper oxidase with cupredoxin domain
MTTLNQVLRTTARRLLPALAACVLVGPFAQAAVPGITAPASHIFNLTASANRISQPDGQMIYTWGYGCTSAPEGFAPWAPASTAAGQVIPSTGCPTMQVPGPTLIVKEGETVTVKLTNNLPPAAGATSIVFSGLNATATGGAPGLSTQEAPNGSTGNTVTYTFKATKPGTYAYYSGTQADVQIEMGLFGAVIVLPTTLPSVTGTKTCKPLATGDFRLAVAAYDNLATCYDREYLFQWSEMMLSIHQAVEAAVGQCPVSCGQLAVATEPYQPDYFLINGRSMPDDMDTPYSPNYPHQPYNGNPHMLPGELVLMRVIGQGRIQHPFHFHGNHARVLARDGNLIVSQGDGKSLAGPLLFTIPTVSGQSVDAIFTWNGQGLNWDVYGTTNGHLCNNSTTASPGFDANTKEYCPDHGKALEVTPPDPLIVANGLWYGGTPYLGLQGAINNPTSPGVVRQNSDGGYAYMWHSHDEREITTSNVFPGGMMMMLIIDPPQDASGAPTVIDETQ